MPKPVKWPIIFILSLCIAVFVISCGSGDGGGGGSNGGSDNTPPSAPTNLSATAVSSGMVDLAWDASVDTATLGAEVVAGYNIYRDGAPAGSSTTNSYSGTGLAAETEYCFWVSAVDGAGNESEMSNEACATTKTLKPAKLEGEIVNFIKNTGPIPDTGLPFPGLQTADYWFFDISLKEPTGNSGVTVTDFKHCVSYPGYLDLPVTCNSINLYSVSRVHAARINANSQTGPFYIPPGGEYLWEDWSVWRTKGIRVFHTITVFAIDDNNFNLVSNVITFTLPDY